MNHFIEQLKSNIENGINWEIAVVDCISEWDINEEFYRGYKYKYWINNEAFDWMTLTERLGSAIKSYLNKEKYQTRRGKEWNVLAVRHILKNPVYTGTYIRYYSVNYEGINY